MNIVKILKKYQIWFVLVFLMIGISILNPSFLKSTNIFNTLRQTSTNAIIGFGMTFVILIGGIDLSVGSIVALSSAFSMYLLSNSQGGLVSIIVALISGVAIGLCSGALISKAKLQPFIVTLIMMNLIRGAVLVFMDGKPITVSMSKVDPIYEYIGNGNFFFIPFPVVLMIVIFIKSYFILNFTKIGRYIYAIGGNEEASRLSGINVDNVKLFVYAYIGLLSSIAGLIISSRLMSAQPTAGLGYELDAIASVVVGGTSLSGGVGFIGNTLVGALIIGVLNNALNLLQVSSYYQTIVKALVILFAVLLNKKKN